jgi:hypothetical protein
MSATQLLLIASVVLGAACKKDAPPRYTGAATFERIEKARTLVNIRDDWDEAVAAVEAEAGAPTTRTATSARWGLSDGTACAELEIKKSAKGDYVGEIGGGKKLHKADFTDSPDSTYALCVASVQLK